MAWVPGFEENYNDYMSGRLTGGLGRPFADAMDNPSAILVRNADGYVYDGLSDLKPNITRSVVSPPEPAAIAQARALARKARGG